MQQDEGFNNRGPHFNNHPNHRYNRDRWGGSRGGSYRRGERGGGGRGNGPMPPPAMHGGFHAPWSDNVRFGAPRGGRGGGFDHRGGGGRGGMGGPGGGNMRFDQEFSLPGLPGLDFTQVLQILYFLILFMNKDQSCSLHYKTAIKFKVCHCPYIRVPFKVQIFSLCLLIFY